MKSYGENAYKVICFTRSAFRSMLYAPSSMSIYAALYVSSLLKNGLSEIQNNSLSIRRLDIESANIDMRNCRNDIGSQNWTAFLLKSFALLFPLQVCSPSATLYFLF